MTGSFRLRIGIISVVGIISMVIGGHFGDGDHFDGGDHFGGGTKSYLGKIEATLLAGYDKLQGVKNYSIFLLYFS